MAPILSIATHATDNPTKSSLAFITAVGALKAGKDVVIALVGEGAYLCKSDIANSITGVGFPPFSKIAEKVVEGDVPVYV